jgi:formylglycine-generating enzyme required for sulfatase activity
MTARASALCIVLAALGFACKNVPAAPPVGDAAEAPTPFDASSCPHPVVQKSCADGWCDVPSGCFVMGLPELEFGRGFTSEEQAAVTLTTAFQMQQHEVTQADWTAAGFPNPSGLRPDGTGDCSDSRCPVGNVTWFDALAYAKALSRAHAPPLPECYVLSDGASSPGQGLSCASTAWATPSI